MSNLVLRNRFLALFSILALSVLTVTSCRKKIEHTPSSSTPAVRWRFLKTLEFSTVSMEIFNNELYISGFKYGPNYDIPVLKKITTDLNVVDFHNGTFSYVNLGATYNDPFIYKLYPTSDRLYIGGNFKFSINDATSLMYYDLNGNFTPIPLLTYNSSRVTSLCEFQNSLIVGGSFGTYDPLVTSANTMNIQNGTPTHLDDFPAEVFGLAVHANQLYAIGSNKTFRRWNGANWVSVAYNNPGSSDYLYSICSYQDELYLSGQFANDVILKKLNTSGVWEDVPEISFANSARFKIIDNQLYLFGSYIFKNGENTSNILVYEGDTWKPIGNIVDAGITDLVKFNGELICATQNRLYIFK